MLSGKHKVQNIEHENMLKLPSNNYLKLGGYEIYQNSPNVIHIEHGPVKSTFAFNENTVELKCFIDRLQCSILDMVSSSPNFKSELLFGELSGQLDIQISAGLITIISDEGGLKFYIWNDINIDHEPATSAEIFKGLHF